MSRLASRVAGPSTLMAIATVAAGCGPTLVSPWRSRRRRPGRSGWRPGSRRTRAHRLCGTHCSTTVLSGHPCAAALTPAQVTQVLGIEAFGKPDRTEPAGPTCRWENPVTARTVRVQYATTHRQGLSAVYPSPGPEEGWVWREGTVGGFPSVVTTRDPQWYCTVMVGLADDAAVGVSLIGRVGDARDVCAATGQAAELVVTSLRKQVGR